jgi:transcriptional regulator GlxA family with amidase domain
MDEPRLNVAVLMFDDVEVLDFAGPFEVFSRTRLAPGVESRRSEETAPFSVFTVAPAAGDVVATGGLRVTPSFSFADCPRIDLLVVPGGFGTRPLLDNAIVTGWIRRTASTARLVTSVCTGALLLAKCGLLSNRRATTHWSALELLAALDPSMQVIAGARVVQDGVITSAGVSAGIDMALAVVEHLHGADVARDTARYIEYDAYGEPRRAGEPG